MNNRNYINPNKLNSFMKETWEIATSKGWHEAPISKQQYLGLIATEAAEAVEADRNGRRALTDRFREVLDKYALANTDNEEVNSKVYQSWYIVTYDNCIKGSELPLS